MRLSMKAILVSVAVASVSLISNLPSLAADSLHVSPVCEPYEPGSSTVINEWNFTPGEQTTVASNYSRAQQSHRAGQSKNKNHHHSST